MSPKGSSSAESEEASKVKKEEKDTDGAIYAAESPSPLRGKRKLPTWQSPSKNLRNGGEASVNKQKDSASGEEEAVSGSPKRKSIPKVERPERKEPSSRSKQSTNPKVEEPEKKESATSSKNRSPAKAGRTKRKDEVTTLTDRTPQLKQTGSPQGKEAVAASESSGRTLRQEQVSGVKTPVSHVTKTNTRRGKDRQNERSPSPGNMGSEPHADHEPSTSRGKKELAHGMSPSNKDYKKSSQSSSKVHELHQAVSNTHTFSKFLDGVVFALSGLVNPERAEIRDKAQQMGGQYRSDWSDDCTLLICAFTNTPKFNQVKNANGTIVSKVWIQECFEQRKLLDIEKYLMHVGNPWRKIGLSIVDELNGESSVPVDPACDESSTTLASLQEIARWAREDVASSIAWLKQQECQPKPEELQSIAIQGIQACLDDVVECLQNKQSIKAIMNKWEFVPRAVQELFKRESKAEKAKTRNIWSDMLSEAERVKWIYSKELQSMTQLEVHNVKQTPNDDEDDDTDVMADDVSSENTQLLDEDDITEAKEVISKMVSGFKK